MPKVFCHNDAQRSNIVIGTDQVYLLDWEYGPWIKAILLVLLVLEMLSLRMH